MAYSMYRIGKFFPSLNYFYIGASTKGAKKAISATGNRKLLRGAEK